MCVCGKRMCRWVRVNVYLVMKYLNERMEGDMTMACCHLWLEMCPLMGVFGTECTGSWSLTNVRLVQIRMCQYQVILIRSFLQWQLRY